nr:MAG: major capsid protein [Microvirus Sku111]
MSYQNRHVGNSASLNSNILPQRNGLSSRFRLSHDLKTTMKFDTLYPVYSEELNPGDRFHINLNTFARLNPTVAPIMDRCKITYYAFFVPNRILWEHWTQFYGAEEKQGDRTDYLVPHAVIGKNVSRSLADYLGIPISTNSPEKVSLLPFRAYYKIWNTYFRSTKLEDPLKEHYDDNYNYETGKIGNETIQEYVLQKSNKPFDYFTSCLPSPNGQDVEIGLTGDAPVLTQEGKATWLNLHLQGGGTYHGSADTTGAYGSQLTVGDKNLSNNITNMYADMSKVSGVSIENLRYAVALQELKEIENRYGNTYQEIIKGHYNVSIPDWILPKPLFLGRSVANLEMQVIAQTSETATSAQGTLTAVGVASDSEEIVDFSTFEHGQLMILATASSEVNYQQGLDRKKTKLRKYDYPFPEFWNLGEQPVYNKEIFLSDDGTQNNKVFGYQERYREYREGVNRITGGMRTGVEGSFDVYHLSPMYKTVPGLNAAFIRSETPIDRALAVPSEDAILLNIGFEVYADRVLTTSVHPSIVAGRL